MKLVLGAAMAAMLAGNAHAECIRGGQSADLSLVSWQVGDKYDRPAIVATVLNNGTRTIYAMSGRIEFVDPLGRIVREMNLPSVEIIPPGEFEAWELILEGSAITRLPADKFTYNVCVREVAYSDGTIEVFD